VDACLRRQWLILLTSQAVEVALRDSERCLGSTLSVLAEERWSARLDVSAEKESKPIQTVSEGGKALQATAQRLG
jgi:hypothetical protein